MWILRDFAKISSIPYHIRLHTIDGGVVGFYSNGQVVFSFWITIGLIVYLHLIISKLEI